MLTTVYEQVMCMSAPSHPTPRSALGQQHHSRKMRCPKHHFPCTCCSETSKHISHWSYCDSLADLCLQECLSGGGEKLNCFSSAYGFDVQIWFKLIAFLEVLKMQVLCWCLQPLHPDCSG